jgi:4-diphosphocytidyl-2-C-methyl-D-erythritol kinase
VLSVKTPAKVNLFLNIRARQSNGYHQLCSIIQAIDLWDRLDIQPNNTQPARLNFKCNWPALTDLPEANLVVKAYHLFSQVTGLKPLGLDVFLHKAIPVQAGLGGGSSDAAAMLQILNHLSFSGLDTEDLQKMAAQLGADVPFFITGGLALATGTGATIEPLSQTLVPVSPMVIVKPKNLNISTAVAYQQLIYQDNYQHCPPDQLLRALTQQNPAPCAEACLMNDFERALFPVYPLLRQIKEAMIQLGVEYPLLSGSGSALFGFAEPTSVMKQAFAVTFPTAQYDVLWTQPVKTGLVQLSP